MAEVRTGPATVKRLLGDKGVSVEEVRVDGEREFKSYFAVWLQPGHGLQIGDEARFYGQLGVKKTEKDDKVYVDVSISRAQIVEGSLKQKPQDDGTWTKDAGSEGWS